MLLRNVVHTPSKLVKEQIVDTFAKLDQQYEQLDQVKGDDSITCNLLQEQPPNKLDISA